MTNHNKQLSNPSSTGDVGVNFETEIGKNKVRNRFGIIQLSDLQFGKNHRFGNPSKIAEKLLSDIKKMSGEGEYNFTPLYIVLSGDISETGHADEFKEAARVIGDLCDELNIDRDKILCIPGNHDVNLNLSKKSTSKFKSLKNVISAVKTWLGIDLGKGSKEVGNDQLEFHPYYNFVSVVTQGQQPQLKDTYPRVINGQLKKELGLELEFLLLNSCERIDYKNREGYVCPDKLQKTLRDKSTNERLKIAILHHQLVPLANDKEKIIQNTSDIEVILAYHKYNIVLTGHAHKGSIRPCKNPEGHEIIYAGCGSTGVIGEQREDGIQNQYCIHIIDFDKNSFQTIWRAYNPAFPTEIGRGGWTQDNSYEINPTAEFQLSVMKRKQPLDSPATTEITSSGEQTLASKTEGDKMKLAFLNLLGGWKEND